MVSADHTVEGIGAVPLSISQVTHSEYLQQGVTGG